MKFISLLAIAVLALVSDIYAQDFVEPCSSERIHERLLIENPYYLNIVERIDNRDLSFSQFRAPLVYTIPVVVHVIHEGEALGSGSNISDAQVQSAIVALNEDFRKISGTNGDGAGVDVEIEFCLASRDPSGNPSTGIVRVDGSVVPNYAEQGIQSTGGTGAIEEDVKALSVWPREDYMNIWVVNEIEDNNASGGVQGYAYFPYNNIVDGIVVLHKAFGTVGNLKPNTDQNRVLTHEVGHYFSLYHTFHGTSSCNAESNCSSQGDRICDTPPTILNASCTSPACGGTQQIENYLDYTPEDCRNMFTQGQKDRMRATLLNDRASLLNSLGCVPPSQFDAGISAVVGPIGSICDNNVEPVVVLTNYGGVTLTSVTISYGIDGVLNQSFSWSGSLAPGAVGEITLPSFYVGVGDHVVMFETSNPNGQPDQYSANNENSAIFSVSPGVPLLLDVTLDYQGHETTWDVVNDQGDILASGGPYPDMELGVTYQELICVPTGCYDLVFHDTFGDGMGFVNGHYELYGNDSLLVQGGGNFGYIETNNFCYTQVVAQGEIPVANFTVSSSAICVGESVNFIDQSTHLPTSWSWDFGGGSPANSMAQNPSGIVFNSAGSYEITLTTSNEFGSSSSVFSILVEANPTVSLSTTNVSCYGGNNGAIVAQTTGNSLDFLWSNASTSQNLNNVGQGSYTLVVTTPLGCTTSSSTTVSSPSQLSVSLDAQNVSCSSNNDGAIVTSVSGGVGAYSYSWNTGQISENISNLTAGYYAVTITDDNGCQVTSDITLSQSQSIEINLVDNDVVCSNGLGSASVSPTGGDGNYQVVWSNGGAGLSVSNLSQGNYSVTVSDTGGCSITQNFNISQTTPPTVSVSTVDVTCFGLNDGQAIINASGGQGNYSYNWGNGMQQSFSNSLEAGAYNVLVEDDAGCQGSVSFVIDQPEALVLSLQSDNPSCLDNQDGAIVSNVSGGFGAISYLWNNEASTENLSNLEEGFYSLTITDDNNCQSTAGVTLVQTAGIESNLMSFDIACNNEFGTAFVTPQGGNGNYQITWSNGMTGDTISGLVPGGYSVTIADPVGCSLTENFTIEENDSMTVNLDIQTINCFGDDNGSALVCMQGDLDNYSFLWSNGATTPFIDNLSPGEYSVDVSDVDNCHGTASFVLDQPLELTVLVDVQNISCFGRQDGSASLQTNGGTGLLSYLWSNGQASDVVTELAPGDYAVSVTDEAGCSVQNVFSISDPLPIVVQVEEINEETCNGGDGAALASAQGGTGTLSFEWSNGSSGLFLDEVSSGEYTVTVTDENLCTENADVIIHYGCDEVPNDESTKLVADDCGRNDLLISDLLTCYAVENAEMYQWKFFNAEENLFYEGYTIGNNNTFLLQNVEGVHYNMDMVVFVRFQKNGSWSGYGDACNVSMKTEIPIPEMMQSSCLKVEYQYDEVLTTSSITGAEQYQWFFTSNNPTDSISVLSFVNQLLITPALGFVENVEYQVVERVKIGNSWSDYSNSCSFIIRTDETYQTIHEGDDFGVFPNPGDGEKIFLDLGNLFGSGYVIDIELYDASGKQFDKFEILPENETTKIVSHKFKSTLSPGVYFLRYSHNGETNEKKLIVQ